MRQHGGIQKTCPGCQQVFKSHPSDHAQHCSRLCYDAVRRKTAEQRFWSHVAKSDDCWKWTGSVVRQGYGTIRAGTRQQDPGIGAHRFSWELHFGPIPNGYMVCHRCDNPSCVRPDHLFLGTAADNTQDMIEKGRSRLDPRCNHLKGEAHPNTKLTKQDIESIRQMATNGLSHRKIATQFGVSRANISYIVRGDAWKHIV